MTNQDSIEASWKIDSSDRVVEIDENFEIFGRENRHFHFSGIRMGNCFHDALDCTQTIYLYRTLIYKARYTDEPINIEVRCDSANQRRWYTLSIKRMPGSASIKFTIKPSKLEHREDITFLEQSTPRSDEDLSLCGICGCVNSEGQWKNVEQFVIEKNLNKKSHQPRVRKTLCKNCLFKTISNDAYEPLEESHGQPYIEN